MITTRLPLRRLAPPMLLLASLAMPAMPAQADAAAPADQTAHCIAVMQRVGDELARQVRAGDRAQEPALRAEVDRAAALIGRSYLDGMRSSREAKARLRAAQQDLATWDDARRQKLHAACVRRADAELAAANGLQRFIYRQYAQAQLKKMLEGPPRPAAPPSPAPPSPAPGASAAAPAR